MKQSIIIYIIDLDNFFLFSLEVSLRMEKVCFISLQQELLRVRRKVPKALILVTLRYALQPSVNVP